MKRTAQALCSLGMIGVLAVAGGCSASTPTAARDSAAMAALSDAEVLRQAVTAGLSGASGVDATCMHNELASIPDGFTFPIDTTPADGADSGDSGDSSAPPASSTAAPDATVEDPLDVFSAADCGGDDTKMLQQMAASAPGRELVVRVLVVGFRGQGLTADIACVRSVVNGAPANVVDSLLTSADAPSDAVTKDLAACTR